MDYSRFLQKAVSAEELWWEESSWCENSSQMTDVCLGAVEWPGLDPAEGLAGGLQSLVRFSDSKGNEASQERCCAMRTGKTAPETARHWETSRRGMDHSCAHQSQPRSVYPHERQQEKHTSIGKAYRITVNVGSKIQDDKDIKHRGSQKMRRNQSHWR